MKKYILLLFWGVTLTLHAQIELPIPLVKQKETKWCGAAAAECVLKYNKINIGQCDIMEYIRKTFNTHGGINGLGCCSPDPPGSSHTCDEGVNLGFNNETVSIKNILKYFGNGTLLAYTTKNHPYLTTSEIRTQLSKNGQPLIAQWDWGHRTHTLLLFAE